MVVVGRQVAGGYLDGAAAFEVVGKQGALKSQGDVAFPGVPVGVVQVQRRPGDEFLGEEHVVLLERRWVLRTGEGHYAKHPAARVYRHDDQRVDSVRTMAGAKSRGS